MRREPTDDEVFACLQAFWNEFQRWRVMPYRNGEVTAYKAIRDQMLPNHEELPAELIVQHMNEPIEYLDLTDEHAAKSYIQARAMRAALTLFAAPRGKAKAGASSRSQGT